MTAASEETPKPSDRVSGEKGNNGSIQRRSYQRPSASDCAKHGIEDGSSNQAAINGKAGAIEWLTRDDPIQYMGSSPTDGN
jgi:hypothetical protein